MYGITICVTITIRSNPIMSDFAKAQEVLKANGFKLGLSHQWCALYLNAKPMCENQIWINPKNQTVIMLTADIYGDVYQSSLMCVWKLKTQLSWWRSNSKVTVQQFEAKLLLNCGGFLPNFEVKQNNHWIKDPTIVQYLNRSVNGSFNNLWIEYQHYVKFVDFKKWDKTPCLWLLTPDEKIDSSLVNQSDGLSRQRLLEVVLNLKLKPKNFGLK